MTEQSTSTEVYSLLLRAQTHTLLLYSRQLWTCQGWTCPKGSACSLSPISWWQAAGCVSLCVSLCVPNAKPVPGLTQRGHKALASLPNLDEIHFYTLPVSKSVNELLDSERGTCHGSWQGTMRETRRGSSLPRMAGVAARGGAKTAWHMSTSNPPSSSFPHGL